jgi:hypothetical protein
MYPDAPSKIVVTFTGRAERRRHLLTRSALTLALGAAFTVAWLVPNPIATARYRSLSANVSRFNSSARAVMTTHCGDWPTAPERVRYAAAWRELIVAQQAAGDRDADDLTPPDADDVRRLEAAIGYACARRLAPERRDALVVETVPPIYAADPSFKPSARK